MMTGGSRSVAPKLAGGSELSGHWVTAQPPGPQPLAEPVRLWLDLGICSLGNFTGQGGAFGITGAMGCLNLEHLDSSLSSISDSSFLLMHNLAATRHGPGT